MEANLIRSSMGMYCQSFHPDREYLSRKLESVQRAMNCEQHNYQSNPWRRGWSSSNRLHAATLYENEMQALEQLATEIEIVLSRPEYTP